jgi:DNA-binding response OmpR family regulator
MAIIGLICSDEEDRRRLALMAGEAGHLIHGAARLQDAVELVRERRPRLMLVVDSDATDASVIVREMSRAAPLLPVVVALKDRDASRAVALMRTGAAEVVAPPWTRDSLAACLSKSLRFQGTAISLAPRRRSFNGPLYAAAVLLFAAAAFGYKAHMRAEQVKRDLELSRRQHWDLPYRHPAAMAFSDGKLWVADWFTQSVYVHDPATRAVERVVYFTDEMPAALAIGGDSAWTVNSAGKIARRQKDGKLSVLARTPGPRTLGLAFDGLYLWTLDADKRLIRKRLPDDALTEIASFPYPGSKGAALVWDGRSLWSLDAGNRELVRHNLERPDEALEKISLPEYRDGTYRAVAAAFDGKTFWTVGERVPRDSGPARLFRHEGLLP